MLLPRKKKEGLEEKEREEKKIERKIEISYTKHQKKKTLKQMKNTLQLSIFALLLSFYQLHQQQPLHFQPLIFASNNYPPQLKLITIGPYVSPLSTIVTI